MHTCMRDHVWNDMYIYFAKYLYFKDGVCRIPHINILNSHAALMHLLYKYVHTSHIKCIYAIHVDSIHVAATVYVYK